jgi:hypothetical protein
MISQSRFGVTEVLFRLFYKLTVIQFRVKALAGQKLIVRADFHNIPITQDQNAVSVFNR